MSFNEWKEVKLEEVSTEIFSGGTPTTSNKKFWNGKYNWLSSGETRNRFIYKTEKSITELGVKNSSTRLAKKNDVVIASAGQGHTRGQTALSKIDTYINQSIISIRADNKLLNPIYLFYNLNGRYEELRQISDGNSIRGSLTTKFIKALKINLPPIEEQKAIVNTLSCLDDKIELNNYISKNLEGMAQVIFKSWFVDFEPFQDGEFENSELGRIPKGWRVVELSEISTVQNGYAFKSTDYKENGSNMIRTTNIGSDGFVDNIDLINLPSIFLEDHKYMNFRFNNLDTVLVMVGASVGKIGIITEKNIPALQNQNMWRFRPIHKDISPIYIHYYVRLINDKVRNWSSGSARDFYRKDSFQKAKCIYPTDDVMESFQKITQGIYNKISLTLKESEALTNIRDFLLPKLMSGEIRVPMEEVQ